MIKDIRLKKFWFHFLFIRNYSFFCMNSKILIQFVCINTLYLFQQKLHFLKLQIFYFCSETIHWIEFLLRIRGPISFHNRSFSFLLRWQQFFKRGFNLPLHFHCIRLIFKTLQLYTQLRSGLVVISWRSWGSWSYAKANLGKIFGFPVFIRA
jgi:hypothetical protein